jgi:L-amino acid N-acyltransferase YncA
MKTSESVGIGENPEMLIRPATAEDVPAIAALLNALLATTTIEWTDQPKTAESTLEWLNEHETGSGG